MIIKQLPNPLRTLLPILILLGLLITAGCSQAEEPPQTVSPTSEPAPTETVAASATPTLTPTEEFTPTPTPVPLERPLYQLSADLDYPNRRVSVEQTILVPHPSREALQEIDLVVPTNNWSSVFTILDLNTGEIPLEGYNLTGVKLTLVFEGSGWQPDEILEVHLQYTLDLPIQNDRPGYGPSPFGYTDAQTNLVDWYVMVPPYEEASESWLIHDPYFFGEYLVYPAADFEVSLSTNSPDLIVAASAPPLTDSDPLQYSLMAARNFVFSISPEYQVWETDLGDVKVYGYYFPVFRVPSQAAFEATVQALALYQDLYGSYDQPSLTMVQADFDHGMEYEGLYYLSNAFYNIYNETEKSYLIAIAVHETAHQWWYGKVANDQALEPWLDEALCTFSELAFYENQYPESVAWWWSTRVNYYQPEGRIDRSIYGFQEYVDQYLNYRDATYLQGAKFMAALKDQLGDEMFYSFLREYATGNQDQIVTGIDFFALLEDYVDLDELDWLGEYFPSD